MKIYFENSQCQKLENFQNIINIDHKTKLLKPDGCKLEDI